MNVENRTIFEGDNLHVLRGLDTDTIDLIYLDPPFNSNRTFEAATESEAAGAAFKDSWTLNDLDSAWHGELAEKAPELYHTISATEFSHGKSMKAYLIMMGIRMLEMYRILKPTGTIYLHCDDNASHYLKIMMDGIFGRDNFRNEIVWQRAVTSKGNLKKGLARDSISSSGIQKATISYGILMLSRSPTICRTSTKRPNANTITLNPAPDDSFRIPP